MRREKLATITAILVLALGIGSTTTIFTLANGLMLRPLPYPNQERLVYIEEKWGTSRGQGAVAFPNFLDFRRLNRSLDDFALFTGSSPVLRGDMEAERVPGAMVTASLFPILGVAPLLGRGFTEEEDRPNASYVVMLSEDLWRRRYGADPAIVGKSIVLGAEPARVIGVMPRGFHFPDNAEIWWPFRGNPRNNTRTDHFMQGIARLKPSVSITQAQSDLRAIMNQISQSHPTETYGQTVNVSPFRDRTTRPVRPVLLALLGAVAFVLLIACTNITNLLLLKASSRSREIAVRGALGGSRARVSRQFLVESLMLGVAGSLGGALLAWAAVPALMR
ncbi:MAG: ABC transporter permease, partial [Phycisphaerales bacterium]|nr:ABC transporter permease [Phycisphaerales bacterium]